MSKKRIIILGGPTAAGKSDAGFHYAKKHEGEIISCDSMQVYQAVPVATNQPPKDMLDVVPHHLISIMGVDQEFDVAQYYKLATAAIRSIHKRGNVPVIVGGSGLYIQILLDGIFQSGASDEAFRKQLRNRAEDEGVDALYDELKSKDPIAAKKIHPNDIKRVIRALEVFYHECQPISELQQDREGLWNQYDIQYFALNLERELLYSKINRRVDCMIAKGLIEEIDHLLKMNPGRTASGIIGIKEIGGYLKGEYDLSQAAELMKRNTRRLAKRQLTWFRKEKRLRWITIGKADNVDSIIQRLNINFSKG
ncbi:MAG: tRNA (adenosine(37)-N6)-dimethylallyltransferase MiaA [Candidatus Omnitrophica bacterium]|nr:tRNA (adenosine(37)-N6)-dimethylallyltransferase MiaA [Candidatus Omnitrophota bacterium]